jgi:hypothetical protein
MGCFPFPPLFHLRMSVCTTCKIMCLSYAGIAILREGKVSNMHWVFSGPLSVEKVTVAIADLPASLQGTKLVQLSDLHYDGLRLSEDLLAQAIEASNQAEPDLVLLTGDYVTDDPTQFTTGAAAEASAKPRWCLCCTRATTTFTIVAQKHKLLMP